MTTNTIVPHTFFNRRADVVAPALLGCMLCVQKGTSIERYSICDVEAYVGPHDRASHAAKGKTPRNEVMFHTAGTIYVYFIYGMYYMLNIVTDREHYPSAVLIRGISGYDGPGKLTKALAITKAFNGKMLGTETGLWIEYPEKRLKKTIQRLPRVGVSYAQEWADKKLRFVLVES